MYAWCELCNTTFTTSKATMPLSSACRHEGYCQRRLAERADFGRGPGNRCACLFRACDAAIIIIAARIVNFASSWSRGLGPLVLPVRVDADDAQAAHFRVCQKIPRGCPGHDRNWLRRLERVNVLATLGLCDLQLSTCGRLSARQDLLLSLNYRALLPRNRTYLLNSHQ